MQATIARMDFASRILIVDDDQGIRTLVSEFLDKHGFATVAAADTTQMRHLLANDRFDLIVLDVMMPGEDGLTALRNLGPDAPPVIMLSAVGSDVDRIVGLELGADDYLSKPCNPRELLARIRTVLRRSSPVMAAHVETDPTPRPANDQGSSTNSNRLEFAGWTIDLDQHLLFDPGDRPVILTEGEYRLLQAFVEHPKRILTRDQLLSWSRGDDGDQFDRAIDVQLSRLRRKLADADDGASRELIRTVRNEGYVFTASVARSAAALH